MRTRDWVMIGHILFITCRHSSVCCVTGIACAVRWEVALVGDISTGLSSPHHGITLSGTREDGAPSWL